jgi:hypothetical protein
MAGIKRPLEFFQEPWNTQLDHDAITATTTVKLWTVPAGKTLRVDRIWYCNPTGLAADGTNAFALELKNGATVVASIANTDSGDAGGAAITADTPITTGLSATSADLVLDAGETLSMVFTEDGTATLPAGRLVVEGRYV